MLLFIPFSMKDQLGGFEKTNDQDVSDARRSYFKEKQESQHCSMKAAIVKWQFLLKLKAKYAGIQLYVLHTDSS